MPTPIPLLCASAAAGAEILSSGEASNSVFLTQSTAFIGSPPNPKPDSQGGGVWVRGAGGEVQYNGSPTFSVPGIVGCPTGFREGFGSFQVGQDVARLNVNGWNIHVGQTAGYFGTSGNTTGGGIGTPSFSMTTQSPFVGAYVAASKGGFFVDGNVRWNWYENSLNSPAVGFNDQKLDAHGVSVAGALGYYWRVPESSWFIEPSLGGIWSRTSIDPLNAVATGTSIVDSSVVFNTIDSFVGRAGVRFGTVMQSGNLIYQPFVALSAWHEFGSDIHATLRDTATAQVIGMTLPNIGTYGQYSAGVNAQIANTGWLGYVRVDYRNGDRIEGWDGVAGIRYQFTPDPDVPAKAMYTKAPVKAAPVSNQAVNWTGFYVGGFAGADYGNAKMDFPGVGAAGPQIVGALTGGGLGYNYQIGQWVLGVEGDAGWTNARGSVACTGAFSGHGILSGTDCADKADFIATATARLGYAWGRALYYAKAGGAWTHDTFTVTCNNLPGHPCTSPAGSNNLTQSVASDDRAGWTVGYGVEFALTQNWSARGEVNYIDFGTRNMTAQGGTVFNAGMRITEGKVGVNYKF